MRRALALAWLAAACTPDLPPPAPLSWPHLPGPPPDCDRLEGEAVAEGVVRTPSGDPVAHVAVAARRPSDPGWTVVGTTDAEGAWKATVPTPALVRPWPWGGDVPPRCTGAPPDATMPVPEGARLRVRVTGQDLVGPQVCAWPMSSPIDGDLLVVGHRPGEIFEAPVRFHEGAARAWLPCDTTRVALYGDDLRSRPADDCDGGTCLPRPGRDVAFDLVRGPAIRVRPTAPDDAPVLVTDGFREVAVEAGGEIGWPRTEGLRLLAWAQDTVPVAVDDVPELWAPALEPGRLVRARCAEGALGACAQRPSCRAPTTPPEAGAPCDIDAEGRALCACPEGDAVLRRAGIDTPAPAGEPRVFLDGGGPARLRGLAEGQPSIVAERSLTWSERIFGPEPGIRSDEAEFHPDGRFVLGPLPAGTWTILVDGEVARELAVDDVDIDLGELR